MSLHKNRVIRFRKIKLLCSFLFLMLLMLINSILKSKINISTFYKFNHFKHADTLVSVISNNNVFMKHQILSLDSNKYYYSVISDRLVSFSDYYYVLKKFKNSYSVFSKKTDNFLFDLKYKDFVFTKDDAIFALNNLYKVLEVYKGGGRKDDEKKLFSLKFISSILSVDYNNGVLALGLSDGKIYVYKNDLMIYNGNLLGIGLPVISVKLSLDNKYLCILRENEEYSLEVINLEDGYNQILCVNNLTIKDFSPFFKIDRFYNVFIETLDSFLILNIENDKIFRISNRNSVLKADYDSLSRVYRIYFYDLISNVINIKTYFVDSYELFDNVFFKDTINSYVEFNEGILYFNGNSNLKYLGL